MGVLAAGEPAEGETPFRRLACLRLALRFLGASALQRRDCPCDRLNGARAFWNGQRLPI